MVFCNFFYYFGVYFVGKQVLILRRLDYFSNMRIFFREEKYYAVYNKRDK